MGERILNKKLSSLAAAVALALPMAAQAADCNTNFTGGTPSTPTARFTDNGDGTVTDSGTNLMWMKCAAGKSGADCAVNIDYTNHNVAEPVIDQGARRLTWTEALIYAQTITTDPALMADPAINPGGHSDWRLPNAKELGSIIERCAYDPAINTDVFTVNTAIGGDISGKYWTSTPAYQRQADQNANQPSSAIVLDFHSGNDWREGMEADVFGNPNRFYVRYVRNAN
jgi:hypothetical protein